MRILFKLAAAAVAAAIIISAIPQAFAVKKLSQDDFIHACGRDIIGTDGEKLELKGMAMGNNVYMNMPDPNYKHHTASSYKELAEMGFNCVRFYINYQLFEDDKRPYKYKKTGFDWLDKNIRWAKKYGIGVIINMHCPQGGYQSQGTGMALWTDRSNQKRLTALWSEIAARYADEPAVWGYGLINEPYVPLKDSMEETFGQYETYTSELVKAVRRASPYQAIFVECLCSAKDINGGKQADWEWFVPENTFPYIDDDNIVYEFHCYEPFHFTHQNAEWAGTYGITMTYPSDEIVRAEYENGWVGCTKMKKINTDGDWGYFESEAASLTDKYNVALVTLGINGSQGEGAVYYDDISVTEVSPDGKSKIKYQYDFSGGSADMFSLWSSDGTGEAVVVGGGRNNSYCLKISGSKSLFTACSNRFELKKGYKYYISGYIKTENTRCSPRISIDFSKASSFYTANKNYIESRIKIYADFSKKHNVPLYLGEFGVIADGFKQGRNGAYWVADVIDICRKYNIGFNYHSFHEEAFGFYSNSALELPDKKNEELAELFNTVLAQSADKRSK